MSQQTVNPYAFIGGCYGGPLPTGVSNIGLTYVANLLTGAGAPTIANLVLYVQEYISTLPWFVSSPPGSLVPEIQSTAYSAINSYINGLIVTPTSSLYNGAQKQFINMMIGPSFVNYITVDTLLSRVLDIEDNISKSGLTVEEQTPLLLATMIGQTAYNYFLPLIASPPSYWAPYFTAAQVSPIANLPFWVAAAMEGALIGARSTNKGMIAPTIDAVSNEMIQALIAALTVTVGKVASPLLPSQFVPRIQNNELNTALNLNKRTVTNLGGGVGGQFARICQTGPGSCGGPVTDGCPLPGTFYCPYTTYCPPTVVIVCATNDCPR